MSRLFLPILCTMFVAAGCAQTMYDPGRATRPYPFDKHEATSIDIQVFRKGPTLEIVKVEGELLVETATLRRAMKLPRQMAALEVSEAHLNDGVLSIYFKSKEESDRGDDEVSRGTTTTTTTSSTPDDESVFARAGA